MFHPCVHNPCETKTDAHVLENGDEKKEQTKFKVGERFYRSSVKFVKFLLRRS